MKCTYNNFKDTVVLKAACGPPAWVASPWELLRRAGLQSLPRTTGGRTQHSVLASLPADSDAHSSFRNTCLKHKRSKPHFPNPGLPFPNAACSKPPRDAYVSQQ